MLEVKGLSRTYNKTNRVLNNINISFPEGSFTIIAGPNGSGKTQLMRHLNGLLKPQKGEVLLQGCSIQKNPKVARRKVGLVFQNADSQIVGQTVRSDIAFGPENLGWPREKINDKVREVLLEMELATLKDRSPYTLSGGEKKRVTLASILIMESEVIVLDEPFIGLDYSGVCNVLSDIIALHKKGKTIILITHDLEKVLAHCSRLVLMNRGEICVQGNPRDLLPLLEQYGIRQPWGVDRQLESMTWLNP